MKRAAACYLCTCLCVRRGRSNLFLLAIPNSHTGHRDPTMALHAKHFPINSRYAVGRIVLLRGPRRIFFCTCTPCVIISWKNARGRALPISVEHGPRECNPRCRGRKRNSSQWSAQNSARACEISRNTPRIGRYDTSPIDFFAGH